ncbi:hypothetical protein DFP74_1452 [Nocardiopsis sp. Huas11]|uniref:hypothetical protein n=1 Tax=Nocardiopsis sp. Huas11 TaxID=2183912 RepID=UPI000EAD0F12|nr:hypothetical protein [Nocardiopsis sp. Huas11]RKS05840.1 hypothetical protein DFP74_1452 [Nocardiopsis sp. Huas11]
MHFSVLVALEFEGAADQDLEAALDAALDPLMAPFEESLEVPPYRDHAYEDDWEETYRWAVECFTDRRPQECPAGLDLTDRLAVLNAYLHLPVGWDADAGSFYAVTTDNPLAKWDAWDIGGRYRGMLLARDPADPRVLTFEPDSSMVAGAPKHLLAIAEQREWAVAKAARDWDTAHAILRHQEPTRPRTDLLASAGPGHEGRREALRAYEDQPAIRRLAEAGLVPGLVCAVDWFSRPKEEFVATARDQAVPGYAYLDLNGAWYDRDEVPGHAQDWMAARREYLRTVAPLIDALPEDAYLVTVDCHV